MENENQTNQTPNVEPEVISQVPNTNPSINQEPEILEVKPTQPEVQNMETNQVVQPEMTIPQPNTQPTNSQSFPSGEDNQKSGNLNKILIILLVLVALAGIGFGLYKVLFNNKNIIKTEVETVFNSLKTTLKNVDDNMLKYDFDKDSIGVNGTLTISSDFKDETMDLSKLGNYQFNYGGVIDKKNNVASLNIGIKEQAGNILDIKGYIEGKNLNLSLGDIYNKIITTEIDEEIKDLELNKSLDMNNYIKLIEKAEEFTKNYIKDEDIKKTKEGKYTKVTYTLNVNDYLIRLLDKFSEDKEVMEILSDLSNSDEKELKGEIDSFIKDLKEEESSEKIVTNVYTNGLTAKKIEIINNTTDYNDEKVENKITINIDKKVYKYIVSENNNELFHGEYNKDKNTFTIEKEDDYTSMKIVATTKDKSYNITFQTIDKGTKDSYLITLDGTTKVDGKKETSDVVVKLEVKENGETINATIKNTLETNTNGTVEKVEGTTIDMNQISEEEMTSIYEKIQNKITPILNNIIKEETANAYFRKIVEE